MAPIYAPPVARAQTLRYAGTVADLEELLDRSEAALAAGALPQALADASAALQLAGERADPFARAASALAAVHAARGEPTRAAELYDRALARVGGLWGDGDPRLVELLRAAAEARLLAGDWEAAEPLAERASALAETAWGPASAEFAKALGTRVLVRSHGSAPVREILDGWLRCTNVLRDVVEANAPPARGPVRDAWQDFGRALMNLGVVLMRAGRDGQAEAAYLEAIDHLERARKHGIIEGAEQYERLALNLMACFQHRGLDTGPLSRCAAFLHRIERLAANAEKG